VLPNLTVGRVPAKSCRFLIVVGPTGAEPRRRIDLERDSLIVGGNGEGFAVDRLARKSMCLETRGTTMVSDSGAFLTISSSSCDEQSELRMGLG